MQKLAKGIIASVLGWQVKRLCQKNKLKIVVVAGSIGKTSTKLAIAQVLGQKHKVQFQSGNYNDPVSVPLVFFNRSLPNIYNPLAWLLIIWKNEQTIYQQYPYEIVVLELGTDGPGQIEKFRRYIQADIAVITAISAEHMEFFDDIDAVAKEELAVLPFSDKVFVNKDLIPQDYLGDLPVEAITYGVKSQAEVRMVNVKFDDQSASFDIIHGSETIAKAKHEQITEPQLYSICAAAAVGENLGLSSELIERGITTIKPVAGRMQHFQGVNGTLIIDDTYNASPEAMRGALDTLYRLKASRKIAILGNMNELGGYSQSEHRKIGEYCDPRELSLVATLGPDANKYLAPAAELKGCSVKQFNTPYELGSYIKSIVSPGTVILAKGSQNKVFAEEAVKILLSNPGDVSQLVRQSKDWLKIKQKNFKGTT
ncbi:UDP-N-acetylmuramoyl-tripeptide--D-alanyl-D-alanine ligase [Candidatus Saccharibacteria bacterium]|nr:UDP-N-acetylmuramoyl-tripeptide--D-alanyl-D-alanine ligase [Candidatus Saccharibacteria bacterium]